MSVLSAEVDSARRPSGSAATPYFALRWPAQKASYFEGVVTLLKLDAASSKSAATITSRRRLAPRLQGRGIGAYHFGGTMPNGTSSDQETIKSTIAPFYHAIGRATARWQHVEAGLFVLAHAIMQIDYKYSSVVFLHIQSATLK